MTVRGSRAGGRRGSLRVNHAHVLCSGAVEVQLSSMRLDVSEGSSTLLTLFPCTLSQHRSLGSSTTNMLLHKRADPGLRSPRCNPCVLPLKVYVHPLDEAPPASKCVVRQTAKAAHVTGPLSSSFASTPKFLRAVLRRPPPRRPATALLEKAVWRDYLGVIPNPGYEPNSLLFGKGKAAYEVRRACCGGDHI